MLVSFIPEKQKVDYFEVSDNCVSNFQPCKHSIKFHLKTGDVQIIRYISSPYIKQLYIDYNLEIPAHFINTQYTKHTLKETCCSLL